MEKYEYEIGAHFDINIITSDDGLPANGADLNFDVDNPQVFCADIDLYETRVDRLVEVAEPCDQTNRTLNPSQNMIRTLRRIAARTLLYISEWVWKRAARNSTTEPNTSAKTLQE